MTFQLLAQTLETLVAKHSLSERQFDASLRLEKDGDKSKDFKLILSDGESGDKLLKLRVRDGEIDKVIYFGADDVERTDEYKHGEVVDIDQRQGKSRAGSQLRVRRDVYQHRFGDEKGGWTDIEKEALHGDQVQLLVGPAIGEHLPETRLFLDFVESDALSHFIGRRLDVERDADRITLFARQNDKHTFLFTELATAQENAL